MSFYFITAHISTQSFSGYDIGEMGERTVVSSEGTLKYCMKAHIFAFLRYHLKAHWNIA